MVSGQRLPHVDLVEMPDAKVLHYLLSREHPLGRAKAVFFLARGFTRGAPDQFRDALRGHASENDVTAMIQTDYGTRYRVEGPIHCPDGSRPTVRVIWFVETGEATPRLATAYPLKRPGRIRRAEEDV